MKKFILFALLSTAAFAADDKPAPAPVEAREPSPEQKEIAQLKEQVAQLQKALTVLKQQRDALAGQILDQQAAAQLQAPAK